MLSSSGRLLTLRGFSTTHRAAFIGKFTQQLAATKPKRHVVETLNVPIGLEKAPEVTDNQGDMRSVTQKFKDFMDRDKNRLRQKELEKEIAKSGMYDLYTYRNTKGKLFNSPPAYWKSEKALYFPNFHGEDLTSSRPRPTLDTLLGKISVVRVFTSQMGDKSSQGFFKTSEANYLSPEGYTRFLELYPKAQIIDINITENATKALFVKMSKSNLAKMNHKDRTDKYFIVPRKTIPLDIREQIKLDNTYGGFIYVLDPSMKIRWAVCGDAEDKEKNMLWRTVRGLHKELAQAVEKSKLDEENAEEEPQKN